MAQRPITGPAETGPWARLRHHLRLTVTRKIALSYLFIACTSLVAVTYALVGLRTQMLDISTLVTVEFSAFSTARNLQTNLLAQETLAQQHAVLGSDELLALLHGREREFDELWGQLSALRVGDGRPALERAAAQYLELRRAPDPTASTEPAAADRSDRNARLSAARSALVTEIGSYRSEQRLAVDAGLRRLSTASETTYRWAIFLLVVGLLVGAPVALSVAVSIHRSVGRLTQATQVIADGHFDLVLDSRRRDEFGDLAHAFVRMSRKLQDLEQLQLDANPLTHLPGNLAIERELERRIETGEPFAHAYLDLDNFKAFNDRYGYERGNVVIAWVGELIREVAQEAGNESDLVGHVGGDDYVLLTTPTRADTISRRIIEIFDREIRSFYADEDLDSGSFIGHDRAGREQSFGIMTISIAIVSSENFTHPSPRAISFHCAQLKDHLKSRPGSNFLIDRRTRH